MSQTEPVRAVIHLPWEFSSQILVHFIGTGSQRINLTDEVSDELFDQLLPKSKLVTKHSANPQKDMAFSISSQNLDITNLDAISNYVGRKVRQELGHNERLRMGKKQVIVSKRATSTSSGGSYDLPSSTSTMRMVYSLPIHGVQQDTDVICQNKNGELVSMHRIPNYPPMPPAQELIVLNNRQMSKTIIKNLSPHTQVYLIVDFVKDSLDIGDLKNKVQERIKLMEDPYNLCWQNLDEILDLVRDILEWQKKNRVKEPIPPEFVHYQYLVLKRFLTRVNDFQPYYQNFREQERQSLSHKWILENRQPELAPQNFFCPDSELFSIDTELELMSIILKSTTQCLIEDIRKLGESYERPDLIEKKVPDYLKFLARELLGAIERDGILSNRLSG